MLQDRPQTIANDIRHCYWGNQLPVDPLAIIRAMGVDVVRDIEHTNPNALVDSFFARKWTIRYGERAARDLPALRQAVAHVLYRIYSNKHSRTGVLSLTEAPTNDFVSHLLVPRPIPAFQTNLDPIYSLCHTYGITPKLARMILDEEFSQPKLQPDHLANQRLSEEDWAMIHRTLGD